MRTATMLRRGTVAALIPALFITGTVSANATEVSASDHSATAFDKASASLPQLSSDGILKQLSSSGILKQLSSDGILKQLSSSGIPELFQLSSSLLGVDRPDFSSLLNPHNHEGNLPTGVNAVKRVAAQEEEKAGHKLFELNANGDKNIHVHFADTYDPQKDAPALETLNKAAKANGITLTIDY